MDPPGYRVPQKEDVVYVTYRNLRHLQARVVDVQLGACVPDFNGDDRRDKLVHRLEWWHKNPDKMTQSWAMLLSEHFVAQPSAAPDENAYEDNYDDTPYWSFSPQPPQQRGKGKGKEQQQQQEQEAATPRAERPGDAGMGRDAGGCSPPLKRRLGQRMRTKSAKLREGGEPPWTPSRGLLPSLGSPSEATPSASPLVDDPLQDDPLQDDPLQDDPLEDDPLEGIPHVEEEAEEGEARRQGTRNPATTQSASASGSGGASGRLLQLPAPRAEAPNAPNAVNAQQAMVIATMFGVMHHQVMAVREDQVRHAELLAAQAAAGAAQARASAAQDRGMGQALRAIVSMLIPGMPGLTQPRLAMQPMQPMQLQLMPPPPMLGRDVLRMQEADERNRRDDIASDVVRLLRAGHGAPTMSPDGGYKDKCQWISLHRPREGVTPEPHVYIPHNMFGLMCHHHTTVKAAKDNSFRYAVCRACCDRHIDTVNGKVPMAYRTPGSGRSCIACCRQRNNNNGLYCAGCSAAFESSLKHADFRGIFVRELFKPLVAKLTTAVPSVELRFVDAEQRTEGFQGRAGDRRTLKRFDLLLQARCGHVRHAVGIEIVWTTDVKDESLKLKHDYLASLEPGASDVRRAVVVVYLSPLNKEAEMVILRQIVHALLTRGDALFAGANANKLSVLTLGSKMRADRNAANLTTRWNSLVADAGLAGRVVTRHFGCLYSPATLDHEWPFSCLFYENNVLSDAGIQLRKGTW